MARRGRGRRKTRGGAAATRTETSAGGVVYRRSDGTVRFLLIRDPYENWGLPKGHIEAGETPEQAALREVTEETSLAQLDTVAELPTIDWHFRDRGTLVHKYCHFFLMESPAGDARPQVDEGISECVWLPLQRALSTLTYENARGVLREAGRLLELDPANT